MKIVCLSSIGLLKIDMHIINEMTIDFAMAAIFAILFEIWLMGYVLVGHVMHCAQFQFNRPISFAAEGCLHLGRNPRWPPYGSTNHALERKLDRHWVGDYVRMIPQHKFQRFWRRRFLKF